MANVSVSNTFTNGTAADATQVNTNFNDIIAGTSDGTKDFSINALTCAGAATLNGNVTLGNSSADDITFTGSMASTLPIKTNGSFDIGSGSLGLQYTFFGTVSTAHTARVGVAALSADREYTIPEVSANASFVMTAGTQTIAGAKTFSTQLIGAGTATNDSASAGYIGEIIESSVSTTDFPTTTQWGDATSISLTAGDWDVYGGYATIPNGATITEQSIGISSTSGNSSSGLTYGVNLFITCPVAANSNSSLFVPMYRISVASTTTYYLKFTANYTVAQYRIRGAKLSARRRR